MSDQNVKSSLESGARRRRDAGFTLPELLVSIIVLGSIVAVLSSAIIVTFKQQDNTEGRLNVSRAEQAIGIWLPADLASTGSVPTTDPWMSPCSLNLVPNVLDTTDCPSNVELTGSNALFLSWTNEVSTAGGPVTVLTNVSYHFTPRGNDLFDLVRIECQSTEGGPWTCEVNTVLHDLPGPPPPDTFMPGVTIPSWVLIVSAPQAPDDDGTGTVPSTTSPNTKNGNRVVVTVTGGGDASGRGGGLNTISITAGGTVRGPLGIGTNNAPTFTKTQSRCGGPLALIVDESTSIGSVAIEDVKTGVKRFVELLAGTPVKIQVVRFDDKASVLDAVGSTPWTKYYDMTKQTDVDDLISRVSQLRSSGSTNWEDAWFRTFFAPNGSPAAIIPKTVVFFTDGVPTKDRTSAWGAPGDPNPPTSRPLATHTSGWPALSGGTFNQVAFNRADYWAAQFRATDTRLIGVGVGGVGTLTGAGAEYSTWMTSPGVGYHAGWQERATFTYEESATWIWEGQYHAQTTFTPQSNLDFEQATAWQSRLDFEQATAWQSNLDFEQATAWQSNLDFEQATFWQSRVDFEERVSGTWTDRTPIQYYTNNIDSTSNDNWRIRGTSNRNPAWYTVTSGEYLAYQSQSATNWQVTAWADRTPTLYYTPGNNVNSTSTDNWRINSTSNRSPAWYTVTTPEYVAYQSLSPANWQGVWADRTPTLYYTPGNNVNSTETDGWRINSTSNRSPAWYTVTTPEYVAYQSLSPANWQGVWADRTPTLYYTPGNNVNSTETDGWRINSTSNRSPAWYTVTTPEYVAYQSLSPADWQGVWADRTPTLYYAGNIDATETDGWRIRATSDRSPAWYTVTSTEYGAYNSPTIGEADGYRMFGSGSWVNITKAVFDANNYKSDDTDGYRNSWSSVSQTIYTANNTTIDESDGYRRNNPSGSSWVPILKPAYDASNTTVLDTDGYRRIPVASSAWLGITNAQYTARNVVSGESDGVRTSTHVYTEPTLHTAWENPVTSSARNAEILARIITGGAGGTEWLGPNTNEDIADLFIQPNWTQFPAVMQAVALGECGATLTFQTKLPDGSPAVDRFTYENTGLKDNHNVPVDIGVGLTVETSLADTAVTFDLDISDGTFRTIEFTPADLDSDYLGGSWACKAGNASRDVEQFSPEDGPWKGIRVVVSANEAVSCIHTVIPKPPGS